MEGSSRLVMMPQHTAINGLTTMAPNLALSKHVLIQDMISSKLQDDKALKDDDIAGAFQPWPALEISPFFKLFFTFIYDHMT